MFKATPGMRGEKIDARGGLDDIKALIYSIEVPIGGGDIDHAIHQGGVRIDFTAYRYIFKLLAGRGIQDIEMPISAGSVDLAAGHDRCG